MRLVRPLEPGVEVVRQQPAAARRRGQHPGAPRPHGHRLELPQRRLGPLRIAGADVRLDAVRQVLDDARIALAVVLAEARGLVEMLGGATGATEAELEQPERGLRIRIHGVQPGRD